MTLVRGARQLLTLRGPSGPRRGADLRNLGLIQDGAILIVDVTDQSQIPALAEPWFLNFQADCRIRIAMNAEDLGKSGLEALSKKWG